MEINLSFVFLEELKDKPDGGAEARIVIIRESRNPDSPIGDAAADFLSPE